MITAGGARGGDRTGPVSATAPGGLDPITLEIIPRHAGVAIREMEGCRPQAMSR